MRPNHTTLKLKNDVVTRWNSTLRMCQRVCELQEPLNATIAVLMNPLECLTTDEWEALKEIAVVLKPFDAVTTEISAETTVTASKVIMLGRGLTTSSLKIKPTSRSERSQVLLTKLLEGLQKRFGGLERNTLLAHATFLDPRFKKNGFVSESCYNTIRDGMVAAVTRQLSASEASSRDEQSCPETVIYHD